MAQTKLITLQNLETFLSQLRGGNVTSGSTNIARPRARVSPPGGTICWEDYRGNAPLKEQVSDSNGDAYLDLETYHTSSAGGCSFSPCTELGYPYNSTGYYCETAYLLELSLIVLFPKNCYSI